MAVLDLVHRNGLLKLPFEVIFQVAFRWLSGTAIHVMSWLPGVIKVGNFIQHPILVIQYPSPGNVTNFPPFESTASTASTALLPLLFPSVVYFLNVYMSGLTGLLSYIRVAA